MLRWQASALRAHVTACGAVSLLAIGMGCRQERAVGPPATEPRWDVSSSSGEESPRPDGAAEVDPMAAIFDGIDELTPRTRRRLQRIMVPQNRPEDGVRLEVALMRRGIYYPDVPLYDAAWRQRTGRAQRPAERYRAAARELTAPFEVEGDADYAIVYFTGDNRARNGPWFSRHTNAGWILETSVVFEKIIYGTSGQWAALDGDYPYLELLHQVYPMRRVTLRRFGAAWAIDESVPSGRQGFSASP